MKKNNIIIVTVAILIIAAVIIGVTSMRNRVVKEETFDLEDITYIYIESPHADVNIKASTDNQLKVVQFARRTIGDEQKYTSEVGDYNINIINYTEDKDLGISYEIYLPADYNNAIMINIKSGNINFNTGTQFVDYIDMYIAERGNISASNVMFNTKSSFYTKEGNISLKPIVEEEKTFKVNAETGDGNISVADKYQKDDADFEILIKTEKGNISVE